MLNFYAKTFGRGPAMRIILLIVSAVWLALSAQAQDRKIALLIGNQEYPDQIGDLATPHLDVTTLAAALETSGFETYTRFDAGRDEMLDAVKAFRNTLAEAQIESGKVFAFVYFAGQGFSVGDAMGDQNLLVASRETVWSSEDLMKQTVFFDDIVATLTSARPDALFVVNDSVREGLKLGFTDKDRQTGFMPFPTRPGLLVAYSAAPGERAPDDGEFAKTLAREIVAKDQLASVAVNKALDAVAASTPQRGAPFIDLGRLDEAVCFNGCPANADRLAGDQLADTEDVPATEADEEEIDLANMRPPASSISVPQPKAPQVPVQLLGDVLLGDEAATPSAGASASSASAVSPVRAQPTPSSAASTAAGSASSGPGMLGTAAKAGATAAGSAAKAAASVATGAAQTAVGTQAAAAQAVQTQATIGAATAAAGLATSSVEAGARLADAGISAGLKAVTGGGGPGAAGDVATEAASAAPAEVPGPGAQQIADTPGGNGLAEQAPSAIPGPQIATRLPDPAYPEAAIAQDLEGLCRVNFDVSESGVPFNLLASCSDTIFEEESIRAVSQARFEPATVDGAPAIRENVEYPLEFSLNKPG